ncbi:8-oxo-dGDP phosphatase NUDT18 [Lutzomyia longipalpis]|uniref:Putative nudix hydrolase fgf-2 n=1 Tax=Lutzomyia longipalpis TaxID=7200 RepID=A0A7G3ATL8_LUTLO|nr:8-oxo-dGDP phosphatase NUDT18 [Lutzomyia longipalpis]
MEVHLSNLLGKLSIGNGATDLCDFSLAEQNALSEAHGITPSTSPDYLPILGKSVNYIVAFVLVNDANEVLMMQEARESCRGKWYLPAGRMEPGETIVTAAAREVLEETGLIVEITTLLLVETAGGSWFRFVVTGEIVGGDLKTPEQADSESLQAAWVADVSKMSLRSQDIVALINYGRLYKNSIAVALGPRTMLPQPKAHTKSHLRLVMAIKKRATNRFHILYSEKQTSHYPTVEIHPERSIYSTLIKFMKEIFGADLPQHKPQGLFSIEHSPSEAASTATDGICLTILVLFRPPLEEVSLIGKYVWEELSPEASHEMEKLITAKHALIGLSVLR